MADYKPHTVKPGERWDSISYEEYGDAKYTPEIQAANPEVVLDQPLQAGIILRIPIKEVVDTNQELLPPWKRS
jgi:hypothetical protein